MCCQVLDHWGLLRGRRCVNTSIRGVKICSLVGNDCKRPTSPLLAVPAGTSTLRCEPPHDVVFVPRRRICTNPHVPSRFSIVPTGMCDIFQRPHG